MLFFSNEGVCISGTRHYAIVVCKTPGDSMGLAPKLKRPDTAARAWYQDMNLCFSSAWWKKCPFAL